MGEMFYCVTIEDEFRDAPEEFVTGRHCIAKSICIMSKKTYLKYHLIMFIKPNAVSTGIVAHESLHISNMIAESLGFLPDHCMYDEPNCYLTQWITDCACSVLKGNVERFKGLIYNEV